MECQGTAVRIPSRGLLTSRASQITILEPGLFDTQIVTSSTLTLPVQPAYDNPSSPSFAVRQWFASFEGTNKIEKYVECVLRVAQEEQPPLRLILGEDALESARRRVAGLQRGVYVYASWSEGMRK